MHTKKQDDWCNETLKKKIWKTYVKRLQFSVLLKQLDINAIKKL